MELGMTKEPDWEYVGAILANSDDNAQIAFFRGFVKECLAWGTHLQVEKQLAMVNLGLSPDEIAVLKMVTYTEQGG